MIYRYHFIDTMERVRTAKEENHYFPKASNQPAMMEQPIRLTGARCVRIFPYYIIQQVEELTCLHFFKWSC